MNKKNKIRVGMPLLFNHDGTNIMGKVTKVKETASGLEFDVTPVKERIYISLDQAEEIVWGAVDNGRPIGVIFPMNSTDLLEVFGEFKKTAKKKALNIAISSEGTVRNSSVYDSSKMFKDIITDYSHPDGNPKVCDFMIRGESLELHCEVCNKYFKPTKDLHYVATSKTSMFMGPDVENFHDAYDCPRCGSQILAKERAPEAK